MGEGGNCSLYLFFLTNIYKMVYNKQWAIWVAHTRDNLVALKRNQTLRCMSSKNKVRASAQKTNGGNIMNREQKIAYLLAFGSPVNAEISDVELDEAYNRVKGIEDAKVNEQVEARAKILADERLEGKLVMTQDEFNRTIQERLDRKQGVDITSLTEEFGVQNVDEIKDLLANYQNSAKESQKVIRDGLLTSARAEVVRMLTAEKCVSPSVLIPHFTDEILLNEEDKVNTEAITKKIEELKTQHPDVFGKEGFKTPEEIKAEQDQKNPEIKKLIEQRDVALSSGDTTSVVRLNRQINALQSK